MFCRLLRGVPRLRRRILTPITAASNLLRATPLEGRKRVCLLACPPRCLFEPTSKCFYGLSRRRISHLKLFQISKVAVGGSGLKGELSGLKAFLRNKGALLCWLSFFLYVRVCDRFEKNRLYLDITCFSLAQFYRTNA